MTATENSIKSTLHRAEVAKQSLRSVIAEYDAAKVELEKLRADIARQKADAKAELEAMRSAKAAEFRDWELRIGRLKSNAANLKMQIGVTQGEHDALVAPFARSGK